MKRRDFLKTPALGMLLPGAAALNGLPRLFRDEEKQESAASAEQRLHQDFVTYFPGIEYFHLGNGEIQAVIQYAPDRSGTHPATFLGVTVMDPERFSRKWSTFLYHPEKGLERTMLTVAVDGTSHTATPATISSLRWTGPEDIPVVRLEWKAGACPVVEEFFVPSQGGLLFRRVTLTNRGASEVPVSLKLMLFPNFGLFDEIGPDVRTRTVAARGFASIRLLCLDPGADTAGRYDMTVNTGTIAPGASKVLRFAYAINGADESLGTGSWERLWKSTSSTWKAKGSFSTGHGLLDRFHAMSRTGIRAMTAKSGKRDGGFWEYQMEWVSDDALAAVGMVQTGMMEEARIVLDKVLKKSIGPDGRTLEAGRLAPIELTEFVQNGILLFALWTYASWTGDLALMRKHWKTIRRVAEFPLNEHFVDPATGLLHNKREWWERSEPYGVTDGFEMAYQFWVSFGLEKAAGLARVTGDRASAAAWAGASDRIKHSFLSDPRFRMVEDGHLIKRRLLDGSWQQTMVPPNRSAMPSGSPLATEERPECEPDTCTVWPIIYGMVDPKSDLARGTMEWVDKLWNQRWSTGGYPRYNVTSEPDPPAPWPIASMLVARAYAETGDSSRVWKVLNWLNEVHGGLSGGWFERYGQSITPPAPPVGVVGWVWEEIVSLLMHNVAGFRPDLEELLVRPRLLDGIDRIHASIPLRGKRVELAIERRADTGAKVNGTRIPLRDGAISVPYGRLTAETAITLFV